MNRQTADSGGRRLEVKVGILGLGVLLLSLLASRGTYRIGLWILGLGLCVQIIRQRPRLAMTPGLAGCVGACIYFLSVGALGAQPLYVPDLFPLIWCALITTQIVQVGLRGEGPWHRWERAIGPVLAGFVTFHLIFDLYWSHWPVWPKYGKSGFFPNVHYLAGYILLTAPLLVYLALKSSLRIRALSGALLMAEAWLLFETRSRPAFLALIAAVLVTLPWMGKGKALGILALLFALIGLLYVLDIGHFGYLSNELLGHLGRDERIEIWRGTWQLLMDNSAMAWLLGHGFGQFFHDFQLLTLTLKIKPWLAPHNFVLEVLYSHGILGLLVLLLGVGLFFTAIVRSARARTGPHRALSIVLLATATGHFLFAFLTLPLWSRDYLLPMAWVVGSGLVLFHQPRIGTDPA